MSDTNNKTKKRRRIRWSWIVVPVLVALFLFFLIRPNQTGTSSTNVREATLQKGNLTVTVVGTGHLGYGKESTLDVPTGILVDTIHVEENDRVKKGDTLVNFDPLSIRLAIAQLESEIDSLNLAIQRAATPDDPWVLRNQVEGRVKAIYAEEGAFARDVHEQYGSVILLSLDGKMAVSFDSQKTLSVSDELRVVLEDGTVKTGTVREKKGSTYTVTLTDNGPKIGEAVKIETKDKEHLAEGELVIHRPLPLIVTDGKVKTIHVNENEKILMGRALMSIEDLSPEASYEKLFADRDDAVIRLNELLELSKTNAVTAPEDVIILAVGLTEDEMTGDFSQTAMGDLRLEAASAFTFAPSDRYQLMIDIDELDILSVKEGQSVSVTFDAIDREAFSGTIEEVSDTAIEMGGIARFLARVSIPAEEVMRIGMSATATVTVDEKVDILTLPVIALQESGGRAFVYTEKNERTGELEGETEILTGLSDGDRIEILEGITEGTTVYYPVASQDMMFPFGPPGHRGGNSDETTRANDA